MKWIEAAPHRSVAERRKLGEQANFRTPADQQAGWRAPVGRPDPVSVLEAQDAARDPDLVPIRHGRMMVSPFTFFRGSAAIMAADLATTPSAGLQVQLCGDAHLSNFGAYASPERQLVFDLNDFDETLPGLFEYDLKRLAASFTIAARNNGFAKSDCRQAAVTVAKSYRRAMADFAAWRTMDIWYARMSEDDVSAGIENVRQTGMAEAAEAKKRVRAAHEKELAGAVRRAHDTISKARGRTSLQAHAKLTEVVNGRPRIVSQPPVLIPLRELENYYGLDAREMEAVVYKQFREYRSTLTESRRRLLDRFTIVDVARKVVGVGSVGTRAFVALLEGRDAQDPLFLQVKEATRSVLEAHLPRSTFENSGERVVQGQQMMQSASDIFLGWSEGIDTDRYYYWRQLRDMKGSPSVEAMIPAGMNYYAEICGWTLARAHARSGDPVAIAAYLGSKGGFDRAIAEFAQHYADQNDLDYQAFREAISSGRIEARAGV